MEAGRTEARRKKDEALDELVIDMAKVWHQSTGKKAGKGFNPIEGKADGPFLRFAASILSSVAGRLPADYARTIPKLRAMLESNKGGIRARLARHKRESK